jgi:DNA-directed RNA polymerase subunit RPC12/RpoP
MTGVQTNVRIVHRCGHRRSYPAGGLVAVADLTLWVCKPCYEATAPVLSWAERVRLAHHATRPVQCPHCGYNAHVKARRLQSGRPLRCGRCGRGYVPPAQSAQQPGGFTVDAQTLADARELLEQLHAIQHGSPEAAAIIRQLEELIEEGNH